MKISRLLAETIIVVGGMLVSSAQAQFMTAVQSSASSPTTATVTWTTCAPATSAVKFGTTTAYGSTTATNSTLVTVHTLSIAGLSPATTYHYSVISADSTGTTVNGKDSTFTTAAQPPPNAKFKLGDRIVVSTTGGVNVRASAALTGTLLGTQPTGALGTVKAGPVLNSSDGFTWWTIDYDSGVDGWTGEDKLSKSANPPPPVCNPPGVVVNGVCTTPPPAPKPVLSWNASTTASLANKAPAPPTLSNSKRGADRRKLGVVITYNLYRSTNQGGPYAPTNSQPITTTSDRDVSAAPATTYYYVVRAFNPASNLESVNSNEAKVVVP